MATEQEWLDEDNHKIILIEIAYHDGTGLNVKYFSDYPYVLSFGDSFTNIIGGTVTSVSYDDILFNISHITTRIGSTKSLGNLTLLNTLGEYDELLAITNAWEGHTIKIYIGAPEWTRNQFILILEGVVEALTAPQPHLLAISLRDKKEVLNVATQETTIFYTDVDNDYLINTNNDGLYDKFNNIFVKKLYDTSGTYLDFDTSLGVIPSGTENTVVPICLGKVFNIAPVLVDSYNHVYQIHECPDSTNYGVSVVSEVRANGVKLTGVNDANVDKLVSGTGGTVDLTGVIVSVVSGNTITVPTATFTVSNYSRAVIHNTTLNEARYVISRTSNTVVTVDSNSINQTAQVDGWLNTHNYDIWYATNAPTVDVLQYEENLLAGCIRLLIHEKSTQITCDIIGQTARTWHTNITVIPDVVAHSAAFIMEYLVLEKTALEVISAGDTDICPNTFDPNGSRGFTNTDSLGIYIKEDNTVIAAVTNIIASVGGYLRFERTCILQIFRFVDPLAETSLLTLTEDSIIEKGFSLKGIELPEKSVNLGYSKNWTIQDKGAVAFVVLESDNLDFLDQITTEYSNTIQTTGVTNTEYPLLTDAELLGTLIYSSADAITEATRRATLRNQKRYIHRVDTITSPFTQNIGDVITIEHSRYGFDYPGKKVLIIGLEEFPTDKRVILEVWG